MRKVLFMAALAALSAFPVSADMKHEHTSMVKVEDLSHEMATQCARIDNFDLCFDIMPHKDYKKMMTEMKMEPMKAAADTTHHVAVAIRKEGVKVEDAAVNMKVMSREGLEEAHMLTYNPDMMYQYVGHFNMSMKGKYQALILFKTGEEKHQGRVYYEIK